MIFAIIISSIISNTIILLQENRYENLYKEEPIKVEGIIISNEEEREYKNRYKLKVLKVNNSDLYKSTQIYVETKKYIDFKYGDKIICEGKFVKGNKQRNYGGFDYQLYLKSIKIYGSLNVEKYQKIFADSVNIIDKAINNIKIEINQNIENVFDDDYAQIVKGLILGDISNLDEKLNEKFQIANISHVLAVSGMHIVYIVVGIETIFKKILGKRKVKYLVILGLIFYMSITGLTSSIVRAGIMGIVSIISFLTYRKKDIWSSIGVSLLIILIENPYAIIRSRIAIIIFRYNWDNNF